MHHHIILSLFLFSFIFTINCYQQPFTLPTQWQIKQSAKLSLARSVAEVSNSSARSIPLAGSIQQYGEYFVKVGLGTPPQWFNVQIDTGSTDMLIYGRNCKGCPRETEYHPDESSTSVLIRCNSTRYACDTSQCYNKTQCGFDDAYGDGSEVSGYVVEDTLTFLSKQRTNVTFGSIELSTAKFEPTGVHGIYGLGNPHLSAWQAESPLTTFLQANDYYMGFGMCLRNEGGSLDLGVDAHNSTGFTWAPVTNEMFWAVTMDGFGLDGVKIPIPSSRLNGDFGALVDSGTTLTLLPSRAFRLLIKTIKKNTCSSAEPLVGACDRKSIFSGYCYSMTEKERNQWPSFSVFIAGHQFDVPASSYLIQQDDYSCFGIADGGNDNILGDTFMRNFYAVFDIQTNQIGLSSTCPKFN